MTMQRRFGRVGLMAVTVATAALALAGCSSGNNSSTAPQAAGKCTFAKDSSSPAAKPVKAPTDVNPPTAGTVSVAVQTTAGPIPMTLDRAEAPCTVESMVSLIGQKYFDNTPCHRLTTEGIYVLQCGDPTGTGTGGPGYTVPDEFPKNLAPMPGTPADSGTVIYPRGTLAMANTGQANSGGSQFFLVYKDSPLPEKYTVFGTVGAAGLTTLDAVAAKGENTGQGDGAPVEAVTIKSATIH
ncbi:peptidylprolyl isomerase [Speluncibacter jeojiensis]|uniref:peptidylprolyl isomerase n=1 Tax=Speluncibacter jeojiensis TaxID=2710754 RepID=UPI0024106AB5|nr:peptidylprolyl isomerase [Rhodococcus sp. D2-41]